MRATTHLEPGIMRAEVKDLLVKLGDAVNIEKHAGELSVERTSAGQKAQAVLSST